MNDVSVSERSAGSTTSKGVSSPKAGFEPLQFASRRFEGPEAFREFAEKGGAQAKQNWEKMKAAAEEISELMEDTYSTASQGTANYSLKLIETARAGMLANF